MLFTLNQKSVVDDAVNYAAMGCSCSQAISYTFCLHCGLDERLFLGLSSGLAGGMGGAGETCGVVSSGVMILGAIFGPRTWKDFSRRGRVMQLSSEFVERFCSAHGSVVCRDLSGGVSFHSPAQVKALRESGRPEKYVRSGAKLMCELLLREADREGK